MSHHDTEPTRDVPLLLARRPDERAIGTAHCVRAADGGIEFALTVPARLGRREWRAMHRLQRAHRRAAHITNGRIAP